MWTLYDYIIILISYVLMSTVFITMRLVYCSIKSVFISYNRHKELIMKTLVTILTLLLVASCSSTQKGEAVSASSNSTQNAVTATQVATPAKAAVSTAEVPTNVLSTEMQALQKESVFFDFDKSAIKPEYQGAIEKQAAFIKDHKNDIVTLEGNCDERGSKAYNLALGNKRAYAVFKSLKKLGVPGAQLKTVSYGKDKPKLLCHEEKCWKENRRVDFVHSVN